MRNFNVKVNGKIFFVEVEESDSLAPMPERTAAPTEQKAEAPKAAKEAGSVAVTSPLPGLVLKLVVPNGSQVKKNDKVIVIEAMKMEHDIVAGADGKIAYLVKTGDSVEVDSELAYIK